MAERRVDLDEITEERGIRIKLFPPLWETADLIEGNRISQKEIRQAYKKIDELAIDEGLSSSEFWKLDQVFWQARSNNRYPGGVVSLLPWEIPISSQEPNVSGQRENIRMFVGDYLDWKARMREFGADKVKLERMIIEVGREFLGNGDIDTWKLIEWLDKNPLLANHFFSERLVPNQDKAET